MQIVGCGMNCLKAHCGYPHGVAIQATEVTSIHSKDTRYPKRVRGYHNIIVDYSGSSMYP